MPDRDTIGSSGLVSCPSCGGLNDASAMMCKQCGFELGLEEEEPLDFEEFEEGSEDEGPETSGFEADLDDEFEEELEPLDAELIDEEDEFQEIPRARARAVPDRDPRARRDMGRAPPMDRRPPPRSQPSARGAPLGRPKSPWGRPAPAKPAAKPPKPIDYKEKREKMMVTLTIYLVIIGFVNYALGFGMASIAALMKQGQNTWIGIEVLDLIVMGLIITIALYAGRLSSKSPDRITPVEAKNLGRINIGIGVILAIFLIQVFGIHRAIPGVPDPGSYNSEWSIVYVIMVLPGLMFLIKGLYAVREKHSYFKIWKTGAWLLVLAPITGCIDALSPVAVDYGSILNHQQYFASSVAGLFMIMVIMAFGLKGHLGEMYRSLEEETKRGEELFQQGRYKQAMDTFDNAIDVGHSLFSQYFYDPDSPRMAQQVRLPSQYGIPWLRKGDILIQMGRPRKAIAIFDVIIELDPRNEVVWNRKGEVLISMGKYEEAVRCFDQALAAVPTYIKSAQNKQKAILLAREVTLEKG